MASETARFWIKPTDVHGNLVEEKEATHWTVFDFRGYRVTYDREALATQAFQMVFRAFHEGVECTQYKIRRAIGA
ncbi:MAG: hypothetical protein COA62_15890 [Rhodobiaceae bacterium]|nr:MAG: hypothetical protein COA62_15890 [Rhodobiaceae bacterium]